jgi:protoheme IX farnesyltransferase
VAGSLLAPDRSLATTALAGLAVFILSTGASALNQYQDRSVDALMERTRQRPLPSRSVTPGQALFLSLTLIATGLALLTRFGNTGAMLLGALALLSYNALYTGLKRVTAFAAVPGAIVGMIPPAIGWSMTGSALSDPRLFAVCFLFFLWQVPHFWLQVLHHGAEYERAGLPSLTRIFSNRSIARITFAWICSSAAAGLLLPLFGAMQSPSLSFLLIPAAVFMNVKGFTIISSGPKSSVVLSAFRTVNGYMVVVISLLSLDGLLLML